jgi:hypothetical protein
MILGKANIEMGKPLEGERYLLQTLLLEGPDDKFKQTFRLYLLGILGNRFIANQGAVDRVAFIQLVNDFLASNSGSVEEPSFYSKMRAWAATVPESLRSITGDWSGLDFYTCFLTTTIRAYETDGFRLSGLGSSQSFNEMGKKLPQKRTCILTLGQSRWRRA